MAKSTDDMIQIAKDFLGSGYDVTDLYANGASIKRRIFDLSKVPDAQIRVLSDSSAKFYSFSGTTYQEFQSNLSAKVELSGGFDLFSGSVKASFSSTDLSIKETGFISIKLIMKYVTALLQTTSQDYMPKEVVDDFNKRDGKWLIEQYGGAVVMGLDIGGQWSDNFSVSKLYEKSTSDVAAAMGAAYGGFLSTGASTDISNAIAKQKSIANRKVLVNGGDPKFAPSDIKKWQGSVKENPTFMNFTDDGLTWIWDLFPEQADKLKAGFTAYLNDKQLNIKQKHLINCKIIEGYPYATDVGSSFKRNLTLYKPQITGTQAKYIGVNGNSNKVVIIEELQSDRYGSVQEPVDWLRVWTDHGSTNPKDYSCWIPMAPPEFVALGIFCRFGITDDQGPPSKEEAAGLVVVHNSLVQETSFSDSDVWDDHGSDADHHLTLGRLKDGATLWPVKTTDPYAGILPSCYAFKPEYFN